MRNNRTAFDLDTFNDFEAKYTTDLISLPTSVRLQLAYAELLADRGHHNAPAMVFQQAVGTLAHSSPELFTLLAARGLFEHSQLTFEDETIEVTEERTSRKIWGLPAGYEVKTTTKRTSRLSTSKFA